MVLIHSFSGLLIFAIAFVFRSSKNDLRMILYVSKALIVIKVIILIKSDAGIIGMSRFGIAVSFLLIISFTQISFFGAMGLCPRFVSKIRSFSMILIKIFVFSSNFSFFRPSQRPR